MATDTETQGWVGHTLLDNNGDKIGKVDQVYRDAETDQPTWAVVKAGVRRKERFVPLHDAYEGSDDTLRILATKDQVSDAPDVDDKDRLTPDEESRLHRHYDAGAGGGSGAGSGDPSRNGDGDEGRPPRTSVVAEARERQREEFGGFNWGAAFFGWLVAIGIAVLLTAILSAAGAALGLTKASTSQAATIGIVGGAILLAILMIAYYAGGYVAGRLSRFDGARQGLGAWLFGLLVTIAAAAAGAVFGSKYNVLAKLNLPRIPVDEGSLSTAGLIALAAVLIGTLIAALVGGKTGERYHKKIDRFGAGR
jgi:PRC-barrel domain